MHKFLTPRFNQFAAAGLAVVVAAVLMAPAPANATPYVITLTQQHGNVVASGSGEFDLAGLGFIGSGAAGHAMLPCAGSLSTGQGNVDLYGGVSPPQQGFGSCVFSEASTSNGSAVGIVAAPGILQVPEGYLPGSDLTSGAVFDDATFASLGVTPGTYRWTWGSAADQSFTLDIAVLPEPAEWSMFGLGLLLIGGFMGLRRYVA